MENIIKKYIPNDKNDIVDIEFGTNRVGLGSGPNVKGQTSVNQKVIMITIDNIKNKKTPSELREVTRKIASNLENLLGIDFRSYGSEWDLKFYQIKKEEL